MTESDQGGDQITSIADAVLKLKELRESNKNLNEPDIEERFARLSLAFKTDKFTLSKRLELQQRQRDIAEKNIDCELKALRESLNALNQLCADSDMRDVITKTQQHVDIVQQATTRMSSRAETYGAIQQEQRMNCAFETMLNYVEHLKQIHDKEHLELEDYRRLLAENNLLPEEKSSNDGNDDLKRVLPPRSLSLSGSSKPESRARLLSAVCLLNNNYESPRIGNSSSSNSGVSVLQGKKRRCSLPVGPMASSVQSSSSTAIKTAPVSTGNKNHDAIMEYMESPKEERDIDSNRKRNPLLRTDSVDSNKSDDTKDDENVQDMHNRPSPIPENEDNKDSSYVNSAPLHAFPVNSGDLPCFSQTSECSFDNDFEREIPSIVECDMDNASLKTKVLYLYKAHKLALQKENLRWNKETLLLRTRYVLSGMCAVGAVLTFLASTSFPPDDG